MSSICSVALTYIVHKKVWKDVKSNFVYLNFDFVGNIVLLLLSIRPLLTYILRGEGRGGSPSIYWAGGGKSQIPPVNHVALPPVKVPFLKNKSKKGRIT
jgi:hypothetical protein